MQNNFGGILWFYIVILILGNSVATLNFTITFEVRVPKM
jgi:hypothetical protein